MGAQYIFQYLKNNNIINIVIIDYDNKLTMVTVVAWEWKSVSIVVVLGT